MSTETLVPSKTKTVPKRSVKRVSTKEAVEIAKSVSMPKRGKIANLVKKNVPITFRYTLGADPELHIFSIEENRIVSAIPILKTDKNNPINLGDGIAFYADNVLAECRFPPSKNKVEMMARMKDVFGRMQEWLGPKYRLMPQATHVYQDSEMKPEYGIDPMAIGCNPSFCSWDESMNMPGGFTSNLRTGSFHIHLGNADCDGPNGKHLLTFDSRHEASKLMDIIVGCASVIYDKDPGAALRRTLYGKSGEMRICPYGVEIRILGNWILRSTKLTELTLDLTDYVLGHIRDNTQRDVIAMVEPKMVRNAIDTCDIGLAQAVLDTIKLPAHFMERIKADYSNDIDFNKSWKL